MELSHEDESTLEQARQVLEHPSVTARLSAVIGAPVEAGIRKLPAPVQDVISNVARGSVRAGLVAMIATIDHSSDRPANQTKYRWMTGLSGAAGGFFGLGALPIELPLSTLLILRSVAEIARAEGEDLRQAEAQLACLEVLALGGHSRSDDASDTGYYATRIGLAQSIRSAAHYIGQHGFAQRLATPITNLIARVAARFSVTITEAMLAKAVPIVGAASGAAINALLMTHFQDMAWAHFTVRKLERKYGRPMVQRRYEAMQLYNRLPAGPSHPNA